MVFIDSDDLLQASWPVTHELVILDDEIIHSITRESDVNFEATHCDCFPLDWSSWLSSRILFKKEIWSISHLYSTKLSPASPDADEVSNTLFSDKTIHNQSRHMATHWARLVGGSKYEISRKKHLTLISKNMLITFVTVVYTLNRHQFFDRYAKRTRAPRKLPLVITYRRTEIPAHSP